MDPLLCLSCGGEMHVIAFIEDHKAIDKIIKHLKLSFIARTPFPPPQVLQHELLMAAEKREEYF